MYEKLCRQLRAMASTWGVSLPRDAANAIEELQQTVEQMKSMVIVEAQHTEMFDERDKKTLIEMAKSLPLQIIPRKDEKPRWIPVTERAPDVFKHVLVNIPGMAPHPTVKEAFREKNGMWYSNGFRYGADDITHWMPLPEPPKEEI